MEINEAIAGKNIHVIAAFSKISISHFSLFPNHCLSFVFLLDSGKEVTMFTWIETAFTANTYVVNCRNWKDF